MLLLDSSNVAKASHVKLIEQLDVSPVHGPRFTAVQQDGHTQHCILGAQLHSVIFPQLLSHPTPTKSQKLISYYEQN